MIKNRNEGYIKKNWFTLTLIWDICAIFFIYVYMIYNNEIFNNFFYHILFMIGALSFILTGFPLILDYKKFTKRLVKWLENGLYAK